MSKKTMIMNLREREEKKTQIFRALVVHQEVVHLRQVVHQGVQAPVLVHHAPVLVTKRVR